MNLKGRTIIITGASRGIGREIALRCAPDGANIVIASKTAEPHPKLPGTIFTVAKEVEESGGNALPIKVDVRSDEEVLRMAEEAANRFGGIDILINNAGAINLTNVEQTPMKRYDLMQQINTRAVFLCSQMALSYLKKGKNAHILNMSPPINLDPRWYKDNLAYTISKFGMTMCTIGMSEEFEPYGIAVNSLWPKTLIASSATKWLFGERSFRGMRWPSIMAEAAYAIITTKDRILTGQSLVDEDILRLRGWSNFDQYACVAGSPLLPDYYLGSP